MCPRLTHPILYFIAKTIEKRRFLQTFEAWPCALFARAWRPEFQEFAFCRDKTTTFKENIHSKCTPSKTNENPMVLQGFEELCKTVGFS